MVVSFRSPHPHTTLSPTPNPRLTNPLSFEDLDISLGHLGMFILQRRSNIPIKVLQKPQPPFSECPSVVWLER